MDFDLSQPQSKNLQFVQDLISAEVSPPSYSSMQGVADIVKAHPEDLPSILSLVFKTLNSPASEWRRINKGLALLITLLKSGNFETLNALKEKSNAFKQMIEFFYMENRVDKGGVVRDKARIILAILNNSSMIEFNRAPARPKGQFVQEQVIKESPKKDLLFEEPKKSMFEGINVKTSVSIQSNKKVTEQNLLDDFEPIKADPVKENNPAKYDIDLLSLSDPAPQSSPPKNNWVDLPLIYTETQEKKPEPRQEFKISCNISDQGASLNSIKTTSVPAPKPSPSVPMDLESKLLNFDILSKPEEKPKVQRSYY